MAGGTSWATQTFTSWTTWEGVQIRLSPVWWNLACCATNCSRPPALPVTHLPARCTVPSWQGRKVPCSKHSTPPSNFWTVNFDLLSDYHLLNLSLTPTSSLWTLLGCHRDVQSIDPRLSKNFLLFHIVVYLLAQLVSVIWHFSHIFAEKLNSIVLSLRSTHWKKTQPCEAWLSYAVTIPEQLLFVEKVYTTVLTGLV